MGGAVWLAVQISSPHPPMSEGSGLGGIAVLSVGVALVCFGLVPMVRLRRWRAAASSTQGRIVDYEPHPARRRREAWSPVIQFEADGMTVRFRTPDARLRPRWPVGHTVDVLYDRTDPNRAALAGTGWAISWALILGIAVVGAFAAVVSS